MTNGEKIRVGVVGATGYAGGELLRILCVHPNVEIVCAVARSEANTPVVDLYPTLRGFVDALRFTTIEEARLASSHAVFFATPHGLELPAHGRAPSGRGRSRRRAGGRGQSGQGCRGQAVQAMNLVFGLDEKTGLDRPALTP